MTFIQPARPGQWGGFSTPAVQNKVIISGSFNNYGGGGFGVPSMPIGGGMMMGGCTMDYGCCNGGMKPFWGGFLGGFLGSVLNYCGFGFGGGGGASAVSYGAGYPGGITGGAAQLPGSDGLDSLRELYPDNKFSKVGNSFVCVTKDGKQITGRSPEDLLSKLGNGTSSTSSTSTTTTSPAGTGDRSAVLRELNEEATAFNKANPGYTLSVNDNPNGDKAKGTDLQYTLTYTGSDGKQYTSEFRTVPTAGELQAFKDSTENKIKGGSGSGNPTTGTGSGNPTTGSGISSEADFEKLLNKSEFPDWSFDPNKGLTIGGKTYKTPADYVAQLYPDCTAIDRKDFKLADLVNKDIKLMQDDKPGSLQNSDTSMKLSGTPTIDQNNPNQLVIGNAKFELVSNTDGYVFLKEVTDLGTGNLQFGQKTYTRTGGDEQYLLIKKEDGTYELHQQKGFKFNAGAETRGWTAH